MPSQRNVERDELIWKDHVCGMRLSALAVKWDLSPKTISAIIDRVRGAIPRKDIEHWRDVLAEQLDQCRVLTQQIMDSEPVPAYRGSTPIYMLGPDGQPDFSRPAVDHSGRLAAMGELVRVQTRLAKLLGLDAPQRVEVHGDQTVRYEVIGIDPEALT